MKVSRRDFVKRSGLALGGLSLSPDLSWAEQEAEPRHASGKRVVILGAGLAGLAAGWELRSAGHAVTILEAQLHPGGRVHTIREGLSDDLYAEAGAGRIPHTHTVTIEWVKSLGLQLEPFYPTKLPQIALMKGKRVKLPGRQARGHVGRAARSHSRLLKKEPRALGREENSEQESLLCRAPDGLLRTVPLGTLTSEVA